MSRYIDADEAEKLLRAGCAYAIWELPSIDIVRCAECRWSKANGTYQWCGRLDSTARIIADDFCSYGNDNE